MNHGLYVCPSRAAGIVGVNRSCMFVWAKRGFTSYGYSLNVITHQRHRLIEERDLQVLAAVQRDFPVAPGGPGTQERCQQMKAYAERVRAKLTPAPS